MKFTNYLKDQLIDFVDSYKKSYSNSLNITLIFSLFTFMIIALLLHYSIFDKYSYKQQNNLLSYVFERYSIYATYSIVDLSKTIFILAVSIFSIALVRVNNKENGFAQYTFSSYFKVLKAEDFTYLIQALVISLVADYFLFNADNISLRNRIGSGMA